jgi:ABC-type protease/lipase transport system fused ATPase/permease subunit
MIFTGGSSTHPDVAAALRECRRAFGSVALFSGVVNFLMLAGPLYMLQVYDRVLSSRSVPTLIALSIFLVGGLCLPGRSAASPASSNRFRSRRMIRMRGSRKIHPQHGRYRLQRQALTCDDR